MTYFHPAALEHQRKRYLRADAYRFAAPGTPEAKPPGWLDPSMTRVRWKEAQEEEARAAFAAEVKRLQAQQDRLCEMLAELKYEFAWRKFCRKYGYNPDQPRVPAGNPDGGRWTSGTNRVGDAVAAGAQSTSSDGLTDLSAARKVPPIVKEFGKWTARRFVSRYCEARINRELPGQFENMTISDIWNIAKGGDARARACLKLLRENRFRK